MRFKGLILGCLIALLGSSYAQTEVVWWDFLGGGDGVRMKSMIDTFNESHPDIRIKPTTLEWGTPFYTKVQTSVATGQGPDIMTYHLSRYPLGLEQGVLSPITDEELASVGLSEDDYPKNLVEAATFEDQMYGVPLDVHAHIVYYNKDILREAGLLGDDGMPTGIEGIDNFNTALAKIAETGKLPLSIGTGEQGSLWRIFYTLLKQQGGEILQDEEIVLGEEGQRALETITNWVEQGYARKNVDYAASVALFTSGEAAFHLNGVWEVPTMVDLAAKGELFDWGAIAYPVLFDQPATWADSHTFAIPNNENMSDEKRAAVLEVIAWMNKNSIMWATAGHIPAYNDVVASPEYQEMEPNATYAVLADTAVYDPRSTVTGVASPTYDAVGNFLVPSVNGQLPPDQAIQMFGEELEAQLR
jgi:multiple sugar transport system substrate-binding protein